MRPVIVPLLGRCAVDRIRPHRRFMGVACVRGAHPTNTASAMGEGRGASPGLFWSVRRSEVWHGYPQAVTPSPSGPTSAGNLYRGFEAYRTHSDGELREVLRSALVVLDTNVLLNLYRYNDATRASIIDVMKAIGSRLCLPHQVLEEFWRNRERALTDPLSQIRQSSADLEKQLNTSQEALRVWVNRAALTKEAAAQVEERLAEAYDEAQSLLDNLLDESQIQSARSTRHDPILSLLEPVLEGRVGAPMAEADYAKALAEGQRRVTAGEPPRVR